MSGKKNKVVICGTGEVAELTLFYFSKISNFNVVAFCQEAPYIKESKFSGRPVVPMSELRSYFSSEDVFFFVAVGYRKLNFVRAYLVNKLLKMGYEPLSFIHPSAILYPSVQLGMHAFILERTVVQPFSILGDNCFLWSCSTICHHCTIEANVFIGSGVSIGGGTRVKKFSFIGMNAVIRDHIVVGENNLIGAGVVVTKDTPKNSILIAPKAKSRQLLPSYLSRFL